MVIDETKLKFNSEGLIPAIVQDAVTDEVLMLAYMSRESLRITLDEGRTCFFSRSRQTLWRKGETSGNVQRVVSVAADCDGDTLLVKVLTDGQPACHTGERSCFQVGPKTVLGTVGEGKAKATNVENEARSIEGILNELYNVIADRKAHPVEGSYTTYLFNKGQDKILKKVGEECSEVIIASKNHSVDEIVYEVGDLFYHLMVLLADHSITPDQIFTELTSRRK